MSIPEPNMGLLITTIGVDSGLLWEQNLNANLLSIGGHTHQPGSGVQIQPGGLNINTALPFGGNSATGLQASVYVPQSSLATNFSIYFSGVDLYANDGSGNVIKITSGGGVNATSSGISSGSATASFVSSVLVVNSATSTPANIQAGSLLLGNNVSGSKFLTLQPPNAMAANTTETLPTIPASNPAFMTMDTSGNMGTSVSTVNGITRPNLAAVGQQISSSCGSFSTTSGSLVAVTNLSVTITTTGRLVFVGLIPDGTTNGGVLIAQNTGTGEDAEIQLAIFRGVTQIAASAVNSFVNVSNSRPQCFVPSGSLFTYDAVAAGTYTYSIQIAAGANANVGIQFSCLLAYEL